MFVGNRPEAIKAIQLQAMTGDFFSSNQVHLKQKALQCVAKAHGEKWPDPFKNRLRGTVFLVAELVDSGGKLKKTYISKTTPTKHAEGNLIDMATPDTAKGDTLTIWLTTSPCSSEFGTREDGEDGCTELLNNATKSLGINIIVHSAHYYQPRIGNVEGHTPETLSGIAMLNASWVGDVSSDRTPVYANQVGTMTHDAIMQLKTYFR